MRLTFHYSCSHSQLPWPLFDGEQGILTDAGVKQLWENSDVNSLNLSANPITTATFDATTRVGALYLIADDLGWQDVKCNYIDEPSPADTPVRHC